MGTFWTFEHYNVQKKQYQGKLINQDKKHNKLIKRNKKHKKKSAYKVTQANI